MKVFISYPRKDAVQVDTLIETLRKGGIEVWKDIEQLRLGDDWREQLRNAIRQSDGIVLALSPNWLESPYCQWEYVTAYELGKKVYPVLLAPTKLPERISKYHYLDFSGGFGSQDKNNQLIDQILSSSGPELEAAQAEAGRKEEFAQKIDRGLHIGGTKSEVSIRGDIHVTGPIDTGGGDLNIGGIITKATQHKWVLITTLLILAVVLFLFAFIALPSEQQDALRYSVGLLPASSTPTSTPTPSMTPTATPTPTPTPSLAQFDVGIGVAYFQSPSDGSVSLEQADTLVEQVYSRLASELTAFQQDTDLTIGLLSPQTIGRVTGSTPTERETSAADIARLYDADILLYGDITSTGDNRLEVQPEFYVVPDKFAEALEITGSYRLGNQIAVDGSLSLLRNVMSVNRPLSARVTATAQIFAGLTYYALDDYHNALQSFQSALESPDWAGAEGKEVLYVLIGNTYGRLAGLAGQSAQFDQARDMIDLSLANYQEAADLAPDYSRSYAGTASSTYLKWNIEVQSSGSANKSLLTDALHSLDEADSALDRPSDMGVQTKTLYTRAQIDYWLWQVYAQQIGESEASQVHDEFWRLAEQIVRRYDNGGNTSVQELASESNALMGLMAMADDDCTNGVDYFTEAISLSFSPRRKMFFNGWLGDCLVRLNQPESAGNAYEEALNLAQSIADIPEDQINLYQTKLTELHGRG